MMVISACCSVTGITSPSTSKSWACPASPSSLSESHRSVPCLLAWTPFIPPPITTPSQIPERLFLLSSRSCCCCCCCSGLVFCRCCSSSSLLFLVSSDLCGFLFCGCCMDWSTCCIHTVAADPGAWEVQLLARPASRRVSKLIARLFAVQCHKPRLRTFRVACAAWEDLPLAHRQHGYTLFPQLQDRGKPILNPPQLCSFRTHGSILGLQNSWFSSGASRSFLTVCCCPV